MILELMALGQFGVFIHYAKAWVEADKEGKSYDLRKAIPTAFLSSMTTAAAIYLKEDIESLYPITKFSAMALGYFGNSIFFSFVNTKKPKVNEQ